MSFNHHPIKHHLKQVVLSGGLAASILLNGTSLTAMAAFFSDTQGHWAGADIQQLSDQGVLGGYPNGTFLPQNPITRAEFAAMLVKALGLNPTAGYAQSFRDVPTRHWAYASIETVKNSGLVSGYPGGLFYPGKLITRAEAMSILANAKRLAPLSAYEADQLLAQYSDNGQVPQWARIPVAGAIKSQFSVNEPTHRQFLEPLRPITRGEVAAMTRLALIPTGAGSGLANNPSGSNSNGTVLQGRILTIAPQTRFSGSLANGLSSQTSRVGDEITLNLDVPLVSQEGQVAVPAGSKIKGRVSQVEPAGFAQKPGKLQLSFYEVILPDGSRVPIQAAIATEDGYLVGDTTKGRLTKAAIRTAIGAGAGAALGTALGPLSGGKVGRGAIYGTAIGAGAGAVSAVADKGKEVVLSSGERLDIKLLSPATVTLGATLPQQQQQQQQY